MKRKILIIIIYAILILLTLKFLYNIVINNTLKREYDIGEYNISRAKSLTFLNFPEGYIANYNYGNILYQIGKYEDAINQYNEALEKRVPKDKECNIRINCALAICSTVEVNEKNQSSIQNSIEKYETAIEVLTENGCANKDDNNGHNKQAQILKNDIQKEIDRLKKLQKKKQNNSNKSEKDIKSPKIEERIESSIQNEKEKAMQEQREIENLYKYFNDFDDERPKKNW